MEPLRDPEEKEIEYLQDVGQVRDKRVIEIGCGIGRMTWRYASMVRSIIGVDPDAERLATAMVDRPVALASKVSFVQADGEALPFSDESFDSNVFAWSL